jgi:hypothetical protein
MKIVNETFNRAKIYTKAISMSEITVLILFVLPSFVQQLMTPDEEILEEVETVDGFTKYFIFVIWLPPVVKQKFIIRVIYGLQFVCAWELSVLTAAVVPFYTVLLLCAGTQFKLISSIIRDMDEVSFRAENPGDIIHEVPEQLFTNDTKKLSDSFQSLMSKNLPLTTKLDMEEPTALSNERKLNSKMKQNILQEVDINRQSEIIHDLLSSEIKSTIKNDPESFYLLECIKLHQASIK